jgi:TonB family protein
MESGGPRFPNASEIEIMMHGDSLPRPVALERGPRYPRSLLTDRATGQLVVAFVVDTTGRAEPRSISFVEPSAHRDLQESVCDFLRDEARFVPRLSDGRLRRTLVFMPFAFTIGFAPTARPAADVKGYQERARTLPRDALVAELESRPHC